MLSALAWLVFCAVCSVWAFQRHPVWGLSFYIATIYVHPPSRWWGYMLPDPRWALLSALITMLAIYYHRDRLAKKPHWAANPPVVLFGLYIAWMCVQILWAMDLESHINGIVRLVKYLLAFWFIYRIIESKQVLKHVMAAHAIGCGLLGIFAHFTPRVEGRLDGVGGPGIDDANTLGMYLATGAICCMGLFLAQKGWKRWLWLVVMALIGQGFVLANSRGAFLGLAAGGLVVAMCKAREHRRMFWMLAMVGVVGFASIVDTVFIERMFTIGDVAKENDPEAEMSARSRVVIYEAQMRMAYDYPLGSGYRGTVVLSPNYIDREWLTLDKGGDESTAARASHNTFLTTLVEQGLPGAMIFTMLVLWTLTRVLRIRRLNARGADPEITTLAACCCGALVVVIVAGIAADYLMAEVQFWLFAALVSALQLSEASTRREPAARAAEPSIPPLRTVT